MKRYLLVFLFVFGLTGCALEAGETADRSLLQAVEPCPVSPIIEDFWEGTGTVAGEFPVWMSHAPVLRWSDFGGSGYLPGAESGLDFEKGHLVKRLVFVAEEVQGDLVITGRRLDGPGQLYFVDANDIFTSLGADTYRIDSALDTQQIYVDAHVATHFPNPAGIAHHGGGYLIPGPGCYQVEAKIQDYAVQIVFEVLDE